MTKVSYPGKGFPALLKHIRSELLTYEFKGGGGVFRRVQDGNCGIIEFQKSVESSAEETKFTVNLGVVCGVLFDRWFTSIEKVGAMDAHLNTRIGSFLPGRPDKWWRLSVDESAEAAAQEISSILRELCVPFLLKFMDTEELVSLWKSGESPGLTETQRVRLLEQISKRGPADRSRAKE